MLASTAFWCWIVSWARDWCVILMLASKHLESEEQQESHHKTEETHSFGQGESQDGIWEKLLLERGVSGITNDKTTEHWSDTSSRASHTDGSSAGTNELGSRVNISSDQRGVKTAGLHGGNLVIWGNWRSNVDVSQGTSRCSAKELLSEEFKG